MNARTTPGHLEIASQLKSHALDACKNGVVITDARQPDNPIIYVNPGFEVITGYPADECVGQNCRFLQGRDHEQPELSVLREAIKQGRQVACIIRNYRKQGELFWNELSISPVHDEQGRLTHFIGTCTDVTERVQTEQMLSKTTQLLASMIETIPEVITLKNVVDFRYEMLNQSAEMLIGKQREAILGQTADALFPPEEAEFLKAMDQQVLKSRKLLELPEVRLTPPGQNTRVFHMTKLPLLDEYGAPTHLLDISEDITARKEAERILQEKYALLEAEVNRQVIELREANDALHNEVCERRQTQEALQKTKHYLQNIITHLPLVMFSLDCDGLFTLSEGRGLEALGLQAGQVVGGSVFELYKDVPSVIAHGRRALDGEQFIGIDQVGDLFFETLWAPLYEDQKFAGTIGVAINVTDKIRAEQALKQNEMRLRRLVESNMIGILFGGLDGNIADANDAFLDMVGRSREQLSDSAFNWRMITPPEFREKDDIATQEIIAYGVATPFEKQLLRSDGSRIDVLVGGAMLEDGKGDFAAFAIDISSQKRAEEALLNIQNELEQTVVDRTCELQNAYEQLQEISQKRKELVSMLAHDLRTPLLAARRVLLSMQEEETICNDEHLMALFDGFLQNNADLLKMVNNMLETYELEDGQIQLLPEPVALSSLVADCVGELLHLAHARQIRMDNRVPEALPALRADMFLLKRLFRNLIGNAVAHLPEGGAIAIEATDRETDVLVTVTDNGPGIPADLMPLLFTRYLSGTRSKKRIGSGLGLYICKMIIELHGGTIRVDNRPGAGVTVELTLPNGRH